MNDTDWLVAWFASGGPYPAATGLAGYVADLLPVVAAIVEWGQRSLDLPEEASSPVVSNAR